jgi:benzoate membrane transport protein
MALVELERRSKVAIARGLPWPTAYLLPRPEGQPAVWREFSQASVWAALGASGLFLSGNVALQVVLARQLGLSAAQAGSWMLVAWLTCAACTAGLSLWYRQPLVFSPSQITIIYLGTLAGALSPADVAGAMIMAGVLFVALGWLGMADRILRWLPFPVVMAMFAGTVLSYLTALVKATTSDPLVAGACVGGYVAGRALRSAPVPPLGIALLAGAVAVALTHGPDPSAVEWAAPSIVAVQPHFSLRVLFVAAVPIVVMVYGVGWVPGAGFLRRQGYNTPVASMTVAGGLATIVNALCGGHVQCISRDAGVMLAGPDLGSRGTRYWAAALTAGVMLAIAAGATPLMRLMAILPPSYLITVAGLAIVAPFQSALEHAFQSHLRLSVVVAFAVAATPFTAGRMPAPFWGLLAGALVSVVLERPALQELWRESAIV